MSFLLDYVAKGKLSSEQAKSLLEDGKKLEVILHRATAPACIQQPSTSATGFSYEGT